VFVMFGGHLFYCLMENGLDADPAIASEILPRVSHVWRPSCFWFNGECS
jgi:hypothetical protein